MLSLTREAFRHVLDEHAADRGVRELESGAESVLLADRLRWQSSRKDVKKGNRRKQRRRSVAYCMDFACPARPEAGGGF